MTNNEKEALQETLQTMAQAIQDQKDKHWATATELSNARNEFNEKLDLLHKQVKQAVDNVQLVIDYQNAEDDDVEKLQEEVEYLRGVIDGAPEEGHINSIINGLDNRLKKVERELNPAIADAGGKIASWMNRLEKLEKIVQDSLASIRELELEDKAAMEEITELQEIVRQLQQEHGAIKKQLELLKRKRTIKNKKTEIKIRHTCQRCEGEKQVRISSGSFVRFKDCPTCKGTGRKTDWVPVEDLPHKLK